MKRRLYYAGILVIVAFAAAGSLAAYWRIERFLIGDARFTMTPPPEYGDASPSLVIQGVQHASRARVMNVFREDFGRSVYLLSLVERRKALLAIDWVKEAGVSRSWPNTIQVKIVERTPVAFLGTPSPADPAAPFALIDADGVILRPQTPARFALPVLVGVAPNAGQALRRDRVHRMSRLLEELGALAEKVSEVDVSDPENLQIMEQADGKALVLILGNRNFLARLERFHQRYPEIHKRLPDAGTFDLRLDDRITAVEANPSVQ
ncbi:MAG: cell division protein FtsQ/DivIB [Acidobacteriales bacterium]|nr:cell division protein FtsQ/DivIB [Terriglobales bacterium]